VLEDENPNALYDRQFDESNVRVQDGFIDSDRSGANESQACFSTKNYNNETDIEWISDPESFANIEAKNGTRSVLFTNQ
jgi:hypothetical protein